MQSRLGLVACGTVLCLAAPMTLADEDDEAFFDRTPTNCISTSRIRNTEIIDDRTILFYLRGGRIYSNVLQRDCPELEREDRFAYVARGGRLCSIDLIQVLPRFGVGFSIGATCALGQFHPVTSEEAELMELEPGEFSEQRGSVVMRPIELPPEDADQDQDAAGSAEPAADGAQVRGDAAVDGSAAPIDPAAGSAADAP